MIYFIYGQDSYRVKEKLGEIINQYKSVHKSGLNLVQIDSSEPFNAVSFNSVQSGQGKNNFKDFLDNFKIASMFNEKKLIILKNIFSNQKFGEDFLKEIKVLKDSKNIIVVFEKDEINQKTKLFKTLIKNAKCQEFSFLNNRNLIVWFKKESEKYKLKIDSAAEATLLSYVGNDLWQLENEIKKLADFKPGKLIKKEDIILQVRPKIENNIFKTIDAISQKDKKQALSLLHKHLENGDSPLYLLSMISYHFRNLLIIKELIEKGVSYPHIIKESALHPFVVKKSFYVCSQFSFSELKKIYRKIFQVDLNIKTGKTDAETALDLLVAGL